MTEPVKCDAERFEITDLKAAPNLNQGHYVNTIKGRYINEATDFPAGTIVVRASQPLANLAAYLLEPQSNDGSSPGIILTNILYRNGSRV